MCIQKVIYIGAH